MKILFNGSSKRELCLKNLSKRVCVLFQANLDSVCEDLRELKLYAEKQIYKFNAFDYLQIIEFDSDIVSAHYFELDNLNYITISYDSCHMHVYSFSGVKFELVNDISDFGVVEQWTTFKHGEALYFLTSGQNSCGRSPVNLWRLRNNEFEASFMVLFESKK